MENAATEARLIGGQPTGHPKAEAGCITHERLDRTAGLDRDRLLGPHLVCGTVYALSADLDVSMDDELPSLGAGAREPQTIDDVIQTSLELTQQLFPGRLRAAPAGVEVAPQLS